MLSSVKKERLKILLKAQSSPHIFPQTGPKWKKGCDLKSTNKKDTY